MEKITHPIGIGLYGCGARALRVAGHVLAAAESRVRVTAVFDPDAASIDRARPELGQNFTACASEEDLAAHPDVNWVFVASPNVHHARQAIGALRAGKNVFCEKPLATTLGDCLAVRAAVRETGRMFAFGLVLRYSPLYRKLHTLVADGAIGRLVSFEFNETLDFHHGGYIFGNWRRRRAEAGTHLLEKCCHDLDLANWLTGSRPRRVAGFGGRGVFLPENAGQADRIGPDAAGRPAYQAWEDRHRVSPFSPGADIFDHQVAIIEYANGVRACFHTNCHAGIPERRFSLCGTEGALRADAVTGIIEWQRIGQRCPRERFETGVAGGHAGGDARMGEGLVRTMLFGDPPLSTVDDGVLAASTAFLIDEATDTGRVVEAGPPD